MPLTESGKQVLGQMRERYGGKKGEQIFYASINARKSGSHKWEQNGKKKNLGEM